MFQFYRKADIGIHSSVFRMSLKSSNLNPHSLFGNKQTKPCAKFQNNAILFGYGEKTEKLLYPR